MHADYYQNTLYPLQDKVLRIVEKLPVDFYLTGGTALSRAYLHHRYSDDLDFFVNSIIDFKSQVNTIIKEFGKSGIGFETTVADEGFARIFVFEASNSLKIDFVNDIPFRSGQPIKTSLFDKTDNLNNILSNKITALGRYSAKDVVDIVFICKNHRFNWESILNDATEKDLWVNPINASEVLEQFPVEKLNEIVWTNQSPSGEWIKDLIDQIITDILDGSGNSLYNQSE
ncbi:MAG: nucleotidyl transferase AbiEii/AbiGii toxin family protein [Bacteroidota bacterium]|nr:nucleotidyl transferase AbiEii/AbiGii toxin family protein [Bacteroidota bacterium]